VECVGCHCEEVGQLQCCVLEGFQKVILGTLLYIEILNAG